MGCTVGFPILLNIAFTLYFLFNLNQHFYLTFVELALISPTYEKQNEQHIESQKNHADDGNC